VLQNYEGELGVRAAWCCCCRIAWAFRIEVGAAACGRSGRDLGNTTLGTFLVNGGRDENKTGNVLKVEPLDSLWFDAGDIVASRKVRPSEELEG